MGPEVVNKNKDCVFNGPYAGRDLYITMYQDNEREFVVTYNANIKPVAYFTGREAELQNLRQRIEEGRKSVLVSGMGGIGKTQICRKLFDEYNIKNGKEKNVPFSHIAYIEYSVDMGSSLQKCLRFKEQDDPEKNQEAAWRELEYLASDGKLLLFVDNVDKTIGADPSLQRLKTIPGAIVLTSRQISFCDEFESFPIGFLDFEQCKEIYEKIRFKGSDRRVDSEEVIDLEYVIKTLAGRHTITVELLAHLARTKVWTVKRLKEELEKKGFRLTFHKDGEIVNIQDSYEKLYALSELTEAEQNILEAFSVFPYIPLAAEMCNEWLLADAGASENDDILMGLYQKGWLQFYMEQEGYALHPVFAQFIYEKCKPNAEKHLGLIEGCQQNLKIPANNSIAKPSKYILFAEKIAIAFNVSDYRFISDFAYLFHYTGQSRKAEYWYNISIQYCESALGKNHMALADLYSGLTIFYISQEEYKKAEAMCKKSLDISERVSGKDSSYTTVLYNNLAFIYAHQGRYKKAEKLYKRKLNIMKKAAWESYDDRAHTYCNLAYVYDWQGEYEKALEIFFKAYTIWVLEHKIEDEHTQFLYDEMKRVYFKRNIDIKFEKWIEKRIQESDRSKGKNNK